MHLIKFISPDVNDKLLLAAVESCGGEPPPQPPPPHNKEKPATANGKYIHT